MPAKFTIESDRILEPIERISEFLFGLIMVLTLTCTFNAFGANRGNVRTMLLGALGCNVAWAIIDAFFYLLNCLGQRGRHVALLIRNAQLATRISNGIALVLLFLAGYSFGRFTNNPPWRAGLAMVLFGVAVVAVAILLGG